MALTGGFPSITGTPSTTAPPVTTTPGANASSTAAATVQQTASTATPSATTASPSAVTTKTTTTEVAAEQAANVPPLTTELKGKSLTGKAAPAKAGKTTTVRKGAVVAAEAPNALAAGADLKKPSKTNRAADLAAIAKMKLPQMAGTAGGAGETYVPKGGGEIPVWGAHLPVGSPGALSLGLTPQQKAVVNQIGQKAFGGGIFEGKITKKEKFTITQSVQGTGSAKGLPSVTPAVWKIIQQNATQRLDERQTTAAKQYAKELDQGQTETEGTTSAKAAAPETTTDAYKNFISAYTKGYTTPDTGKKIAAATVQKSYNAQLVKAGLLNTTNPTVTEAAHAFQTVMKQAVAGKETAKAALATMGKANAPNTEEAVAANQTGQAQASYYITKFKTIANDYQIPLSQASLNSWAAASAAEYNKTKKTGNYVSSANPEAVPDSIAAFTQYAQQTAAGLYPTFATQINKGITTKTLLDPYAQVAASVLGFGSNTDYSTGGSASSAQVTDSESALGITWQNPKWSVASQGGRTATGKPAPMSLDQWRQHIITTKSYGWQNTDAAKNLNTNVGNSLLQDFGFVKL